MLSRGKKMKSSCPKGGFRTWSSIGGVRIFNGIAQCFTQLKVSESLSNQSSAEFMMSFTELTVTTTDSTYTYHRYYTRSVYNIYVRTN